MLVAELNRTYHLKEKVKETIDSNKLAEYSRIGINYVLLLLYVQNTMFGSFDLSKTILLNIK